MDRLRSFAGKLREKITTQPSEVKSSTQPLPEPVEDIRAAAASEETLEKMEAISTERDTVATLTVRDAIKSHINDAKWGIKFKAEETVKKAKSTVLTTAERLDEERAWEHIRKPHLTKLFTEAGFTHPDQAVEIVKYLEIHIHHKEYVHDKEGNFVDSGKQTYYRFLDRDIDQIKLLTEGIENPVGLLQSVQNAVELPQYRHQLSDFCEYVGTIKDHPRLPELLSKLPLLGPLERIDTKNIRPNGEYYQSWNYDKDGKDRTVSDPLITLLNLPKDQFDTFFQQNTIDWVRKFNLNLINLTATQKYRQTKENFGITAISFEALPDLLFLASEPDMQTFFINTLIQSGSNGYAPSQRDISAISNDVEKLMHEVPEVLALQKTGFYMTMGHYTYRTGNEYILQFSKSRQRMQELLANPLYCANARLLADHKIASHPFTYFYNEDVPQLFQTPDTHVLQKALAVWEKNDTQKDAKERRNTYEIPRIIETITKQIEPIPPDLLKKYGVDAFIDADGFITQKYLDTIAISAACGFYNSHWIGNQMLSPDVLQRLDPDALEFWNSFQKATGYYEPQELIKKRYHPNVLTDTSDVFSILDFGIKESRNISNVIDTLKQNDMLSYISQADQAVLQYIGDHYYYDSVTSLILYNHRGIFSELVVNGEKTQKFYELLLEGNPSVFVDSANRDTWRQIFGQENVNRFLDVLPKITDEKRNAFTHNEYDRTSSFINSFVQDKDADFTLTGQDFSILTEYVRQYGLSRSPILFRYFKHLYLNQNGSTIELPFDIQQSGVTSTEELNMRFKELATRVYGTEQILDLSSLSTFEVRMLEVITGRSTHVHGGGSKIDTIIENFKDDMSRGDIAPLKEAYTPETINVSQVELQFDPEPVRPHFEILRSEIMESMQDPYEINSLLADFEKLMQTKISDIETSKAGSEGGKLQFMEREQARFREYISRVGEVASLDDLVSTVVDMKFDKTEKGSIDNIMRRVTFRKIFQRHFSHEMINDMRGKLEGDITPEALLSVVNVVDHIAKAHVLNTQGNNEDGYWQDEAFQKIKASKNGRRLTDIFSPHAAAIRETVDNFTTLTTGNSSIQVIPDRGFIGEMSGYVANACYTREYPLLKRFPDMTPYKFVLNEGGEQKLIGSVLVFEVNDSEGNLSLLVRPLNIPDEQAVDVREFTERFMDIMEGVARKRGATQVLVPGNSGAISNYQMTIGHIQENYIYGKEPIKLQDRFNFNSYDITNNCYVTRTVQPVEAGLPLAA